MGNVESQCYCTGLDGLWFTGVDASRDAVPSEQPAVDTPGDSDGFYIGTGFVSRLIRSKSLHSAGMVVFKWLLGGGSCPIYPYSMVPARLVP